MVPETYVIIFHIQTICQVQTVLQLFRKLLLFLKTVESRQYAAVDFVPATRCYLLQVLSEHMLEPVEQAAGGKRTRHLRTRTVSRCDAISAP
jgi:hypothetical protein